VDFTRSDVDGVPTLWAPGRGSLRAGLVFRVGRADETLARGGITHLVEHLALHPVGLSDHPCNGTTGQITTTFDTQGDPDRIVAFFATVCRALRDLPLERLETEKSILRTEAHGRGAHVTSRLLRWRYGPATYGLADYPEFGLQDITGEDLRTWIARWFTRGNAVLWVAGGPPPAHLRLDLPDGPRRPAPPAMTVLPRTPAYFTTDVDGVGFDAVVDRRTAAGVYAAVLQRRLHTALRLERGVSYTTEAAYRPRDGGTAVVTAFVDARLDGYRDVTEAFVDVLTDLALDPAPDDEIHSAWASANDELSHPDAAAAMVASAVTNLLTGGPVTTPAQLLAELAEVSAGQVRDVAREVLASGLLMLPTGQAVGRAGFAPAPAWSTDLVEGRTYRWAGQDAGYRLVIGPDGVSLVVGENVATVRYADCAGMVAWPDGARSLFGPDAINVHIEPNLWNIPGSEIYAIDAAVPADRIARMPERAPDAIPQAPPPLTGSPAPAVTDRGRTLLRRMAYAGVTVGIVAAALLLLAYAPMAPDGVLVGMVVGLSSVFSYATRRRRNR
jgi:predicted Zn-dependent peptidase